MASKDVAHRAVEKAIRVRSFEHVLLEEFEKGGIRGTVHTSLGQEMTPALVSEIVESDDKIFGTHRSHAYFLSLTDDYEGLAREIFGKVGGCSKGIGGSQHLLGKQIMTNGIQGGFVPIAGGFSLDQSTAISIAVIGDGTLGQGVLYETLNLAAKLSMPLLILMEDNGIAQSTPSSAVFRGDLRQRVEGFGVSFFETSDADLAELEETISETIGLVRESRCPAFLRVQTQRLGPHSKGDDNRPIDVIKSLAADEPLERLLAEGHFSRNTLANEFDEMRALFSRVRNELASEEHYSESVWEANLMAAPVPKGTDGVQEEDSLRLQVRKALSHSLETSVELRIFGEDIESLPVGMERPYSGAFGVMGALSEKFPGRVTNTPISEQAIVGMGVGRALSGRPTIVEIMFGDFTTLIVDQIRQQATKISWMYGDFVAVPLVVRTASGGRRGYGPTHSQSLESMFLGIPNLNVYVMSPLGFPPNLFEFLLSTGYPSMVFEEKDMYTVSSISTVHPAYALEQAEVLPSVATVTPLKEAPSLCIVTYGNAARTVLEEVIPVLASDYEIFVEVLVYELISPLDLGPLETSAKLSGKILVVEEGDGRSGITASIASWKNGLGMSNIFWIQSVSGSDQIGANEFSEGRAKLNPGSVIEASVAMSKGVRN